MTTLGDSCPLCIKALSMESVAKCVSGGGVMTALEKTRYLDVRNVLFFRGICYFSL